MSIASHTVNEFNVNIIKFGVKYQHLIFFELLLLDTFRICSVTAVYVQRFTLRLLRAALVVVFTVLLSLLICSGAQKPENVGIGFLGQKYHLVH